MPAAHTKAHPDARPEARFEAHPEARTEGQSEARVAALHEAHPSQLPVLETAGLAAGYEGTAIIEDVHLVVEAGQIVTLIGPNGSGKSTILKTIAGQLPKLGGSIALSGKPLESLSAHARSVQLSVVLTERVRTELLTCAHIVEAGRYPYTGRLGLLSNNDRRVVRESMELVGVWDLRDCDFAQLSDGQRQRIMLARAICQEPCLLVLDEPSSFLDIRYQIELLEVLKYLATTRNVGVIMSLHELSLAQKVSDRVVCVKDGRIMAQGSPEEVFVPNVIDALYNLKPGTYDPRTGNIVLDAC